MKSLSISHFISFLSILSVVLLVNFSSASSDLFYPPEGTVSNYRLNFNNFPADCVLNGTHIDMNDYDFDSSVCIENPTYAEFSISYSIFGDFLEEQIDGYMHNATSSVRFQVSFLINISTRLYVNEHGTSWDEYTPGYIDPRDISIGSQINITRGSLNVTVKETVNVVGMDREAWKLEFISEDMNETYHYDVITGILLSIKWETESSVEQSMKLMILPIHPFNQAPKISSYEQVLISTNAWPTSRTTTFPLFEIILLSCVLAFIIKKNRIS